MTRGLPILEFDPRREAVIEPRPLEATLPRGCVLCFFHEVIDRWRKDGTIQPITAISTTIGAHPSIERPSASCSSAWRPTRARA